MAEEYKGWHSRGYLPHLDVPDLAQFVTFRTFGSFRPHNSESMRDALRKEEIENFRWDEIIDSSPEGRIFADPEVAACMVDSLRRSEELGHFNLFAWAVMANHVHLLFRPGVGKTVPRILQSLKSASARHIRQLRASSEPVWAADYFDRYMRDETHFVTTALYIEKNPVRAGLGENYPFVSRNYFRE